MQKQRKEGKVIIDFLRDVVNQIFAWNNRRVGKIVLTRNAFVKMQLNQLDTETIEDTFRNGIETDEGKIVQDYYNYSVGLFYIWDEVKGKYVITTCWKSHYKQLFNKGGDY